MATLLFSKQFGHVSSFHDPALPATTTLRVDNWGGFYGFKSIITRVTVASRGNYQFLHTLGGKIYIYVFGDRIGQLSLSGLAFKNPCGLGVSDIGIERVIGFYNANRITARQTPLRITIGTRTTLVAYLTEIQADIENPSEEIYRFNLGLALVPIPARRTRSVDRDDGIVATTTPEPEPVA